MKRLLILGIVSAAISITAGRASAEDALSAIQTSISGFGATIAKAQTKAGDQVTLNIDESKLMEAMPIMREVGLLNDEMPNSFFRQRPITTANISAMLFCVTALAQLYKSNSTLDRTHWVISLLHPDAYGNSHRVTLFTFDMNRDVINRINWENFQAQNLPKVAVNFRTTDWDNASMASEE